MKTLFRNGTVVDVFSETLIKADVLIEDEKIIGLGEYERCDADIVEDITGKFISPGFIDSHIHIESTMLSPYEFAKTVIKCGTTAVVADPHEIANVCGVCGIEYMLKASENLPLDVYIMLPSCVPATDFDESYEKIDADKLLPFF